MPGWELIGKEERDAVNEVFDKGGVLYRYAWTDKRQNIYMVDDFERAVAKKMDVAYAYGVSSGTAALHAALKAMDIRPGDEVITQSHTFVATVEAIIEAGAKPVITEVDKTLNMDHEDLEKKITEKTKAIIPVHMMGIAAKMKEIQHIAKTQGIPILEDNAQSFGGTYEKRYLGTIGDVGITSFDFGKVLTTGEGGMVFTDNESIFRRVREYSDHGHELNPDFPRGEDTRTITGVNYKMAELQGAIGLAQLKKLDYIINHQRKHKQKIKDGIKDIPGIEFRNIPNPEGDTGECVIFFLETKAKTKKFMYLLKEKGFGTKNLPDAINWHYTGTWTHIFKNYDEYQGKDLEQVWKQSTDILRRAIALPIFVNMEDAQIQKTIDAVHECIAKL